MIIARATASVEQVTLGAAISRLILSGHDARTTSITPGFPMFSAIPGHIITNDLVAQYRDDVP